MMKVSQSLPTDMFDHLRDYRYILLTGPHRAGTTVAALMMANDLSIEYYEEKNIAGPGGIYDVDLRSFFDRRLVLRCPSLCHTVHTYADVLDLAVVMLIRPVDEIRKSQERVRWGFAELEMEHYTDYEPPVADAKYRYWRDVQARALGDRAFTLNYHSLINHPMWVSEEKRTEFTIGQYQVGKPRGKRYQLEPEQYERVKGY